MKIWVYLDGRQQGPFELEQLFDMPVDESTKVWFDGLPRWCAAGEIPELKCLFDPTAKESATSDQSDSSELSEKSEPLDATPAPAASSPYAPGRRKPQRQLPSEPCPATHLGLSIFLAICCCSPLSIGALVASICTSSFYQNGQLDKAKKASEWAAWLIMISLALGFLPMMLLGSLFG